MNQRRVFFTPNQRVFFTRLANVFFLTSLQCVPFHIIQKLSDLLQFLRCLIFISEEDNSYLNILFFLFHKIINLFDSYYGIGTNRHAVSSRKLMLLSEGIYFLKHFFSCIMFGKLTAKEKIVPRSPQSHSIARTP